MIIFDRHFDLKCLGERALDEIITTAQTGGSLDGLNRRLPFQDFESFPFGLDNFLYAAIHLEILQRIVWVHPEPVPISSRQLARILLQQLALLSRHGGEVLDSFVWDETGARARICGASVEITTLRRLPMLENLKDAWVDFDLDFFATERGEMLHSPGEAVAALRRLHLPSELPTMTYSISSGFLNDELRWIGTRLAAEFGASIKQRPGRMNPARRALQVAARGESLARSEFDELERNELYALGAPGRALAAVLALRIPDEDLAESRYDAAVLGGDRAFWPAYVRGLHHMRGGDYKSAREWFARSSGEGNDSLQVHAACLDPLCLARLGELPKALQIALDCVERFPLRIQTIELAGNLAEALDSCDAIERCSEAREAVGSLLR